MQHLNTVPSHHKVLTTDKYKYLNGDEYHGGLYKCFQLGVSTLSSTQDVRPHGDGTMKYANGDVYKGMWKHGNRHGLGTMTYAPYPESDPERIGGEYNGMWEKETGGEYNGMWENDKRNGEGTMAYDGNSIYVEGVYTGTWKNDKRHGKGKMIWGDGMHGMYEGTWKNDKKHGQGKEIYTNGDQYEGSWGFDTRYGPGTMIYKNGDQYEADWYFDVRHGEGTMIYVNGDHYEGLWKDDKRNSCGTMIYANGDDYEGFWKDDKRNGSGIMTLTNGQKVEGWWEDDMQYDTKQTYEHEKRKLESNKESKRTCSICLESPPSHIFECGHKTVCASCAGARVWTNCPICRSVLTAQPFRVFE